MFSSAFTKVLLNKLTVELNDATAAAFEVPYLQDIFFNWAPPTIAYGAITSIVAFSFGDSPNPAGAGSLPLPGPVNTAIADAVYHIHKFAPVPVYAQWEVAQVLASKHNMTVQSVSPPTVSGSKITYPSLAQVASAVTAITPAASLGSVAVVTHVDQVKLAVQAAQAAGMTAFAPPTALPALYDPQASQSSNRRRDLYLLLNMGLQFQALRANLIASEYPNG